MGRKLKDESFFSATGEAFVVFGKGQGGFREYEKIRS